MKNKSVFTKQLFAFALVAILGSSCANLDETVYDEIPKSEYDKTLSTLSEAQMREALNGIYSNLGAVAGHNNLFSVLEVSSDEMIIPQRGGDWYDGGQWIRMHRHAYQPSEESLNNVWKLLYSGIITCNRILVQSKESNPALAGQIEPEIKAMRALYYFWLCDMFGGVPVVTTWSKNLAATIGTEDVQKTRAEVYAFIEGELTTILASPKLSKSVSDTTYGKMNYWGVKALQAKLYQNAGVYKGTPEWSKCAAACQEIIDGNKYIIEPDFFANFNATNNNSKENIFVIPYQAGKLDGFNLAQMTLHYESQATYKLEAQPWNGYCSSADFYNSFDAADKRKKSLLAGVQLKANGVDTLFDGGAESNDPDGKMVNFTPALNELYPNALRQAGPRVGKYAFALGAKPNLDNDFPILRYGDVLLMRAEALWRQNAADATALALVNQIRARAGLANVAALTADDLLKELWREKFAETWRRNDMIRFGKYFQAYGFKATTDQPCKNVFPIPAPQMSANLKLTQNECYR